MENKYASKLDAKKRRKILKMFLDNYSLRYIAEKFNVHVTAICYCVAQFGYHREFSQAKKNYIMKNSKMKVKDILKIRKLHCEDGISSKSLAKKYGVSCTIILRIVKGISYPWIGGKIKKDRYSLPIENNQKFIKPVKLFDRNKKKVKFGTKKGTKRRFERGVIKEIADKNGLNKSSVLRTLERKNYRPDIKKQLLKVMKKN